LSPFEPCGSPVDLLRSCYSTMRVTRPGGAPVLTHWWFRDPGTPWGPRGPWGSNNWMMPNPSPGQVGEVEGATRPWRDGSQPADACGGVPTPPCAQQSARGSIFMTIPAFDPPLVIELTVNLGQVIWSGGKVVFNDPCWIMRGQVTCIGATGDSPLSMQFVFGSSRSDGTVVANDFQTFDMTHVPYPFSITLPTPNVSAACHFTPTPIDHVVFTADPPAGLRRPLALV